MAEDSTTKPPDPPQLPRGKDGACRPARAYRMPLSRRVGCACWSPNPRRCASRIQLGFLVAMAGCGIAISADDTASVPPQPAASARSATMVPWRAAWCSSTDPRELIPLVKALRFTAVVAQGSPERMQHLAKACRDSEIECYYRVSLEAFGPEKRLLAQVMTPDDAARLDELARDPDPAKHHYQFGGEPLPGKHDVLVQPLLCFHRPEARQLIRRDIQTFLTACPELAGIALDCFGYRNYRSCHCEVSETQFKAFRQEHPDLPEEACRHAFSLETLVGAINETADAVREIRPEAKTVIHVYPVFQPEPLYGRRLKVDYCCETVAWFFKPFWEDDKIVRYTREVVDTDNRVWSGSRGIPFVGLYAEGSVAAKSAERLMHELTLVFRNCPSRSLSIYRFDEFLENASHVQALSTVLETVWPE